jgi:Na+-transporting NADH:ubiquinone oxidoreductase subunit F
MIVLVSILVLGGLLVVLAAGLVLAERVLVYTGPCEIRVNAGEQVFQAQGGQSLLEALIDREIYIPSGCGGKGTCGLCKVQVVEGAGGPLATEVGYLSRSEIRAGVRLACQVRLRGPLEVRIPEELLNVRMFEAAVVGIVDHTEQLREIHLDLGAESLGHRPGQYVQVQAPGPEGLVFRAYSICTPAHQSGQITLLVRRVPGGIASTYLHRLDVGQIVRFTGPYGEFRLREDPTAEIVCVGGGCGLAPMRSIIETVCHRWPDRPVRLFYGCRTRDEAVWLTSMRALAEAHENFHLFYCLSDESPADWDGQTGLVHLAVEKHLLPGPGPRQAFVCGPEEMIRAVESVLIDKGLDPAEIFYDTY